LHRRDPPDRFLIGVPRRKSRLHALYGADTHAEAAAAVFSIIETCRLHAVDPFAYLDEVLRVLPYWPQERYLELAPQHCLATRATLASTELERPLVAHHGARR
jgi:hypothetical protein